MGTSRKLAAEFIGTFWLVLGGCGTAVLAGSAAGNVGISLAFGLTVLTGAYAFGHISGAHFNPAVTLGLWMGGRFPAKDVIGYWIAQVVGGLAAGAVLYVIASGTGHFDPATGFAANGYAENSPGGYSMQAAAVCEVVMTFMFLMVILGATSYKEPAGFAPLAIGLALTLIHLISIPVTNTSVNPARSMGVAFFEGGTAVKQLWFFWVMPLIGAGAAGVVARWLSGNDRTAVESKM